LSVGGLSPPYYSSFDVTVKADNGHGTGSAGAHVTLGPAPSVGPVNVTNGNNSKHSGVLVDPSKGNKWVLYSAPSTQAGHNGLMAVGDTATVLCQRSVNGAWWDYVKDSEGVQGWVQDVFTGGTYPADPRLTSYCPPGA
jgi:hypothetical protein